MKIPDNSLQSFVQFFRKDLEDVFAKNELEAHLYEVLYSLFGLKRTDILLEGNRNFSESDILRLFRVIKELKKGRPLAYVLQEKQFYGMDFYVDENVLIPRPETEELVDWILKSPHVKKADIGILDIGTGSGCIAIALRKNLPNAQVTAIDISEDALDVAKRNACKLSVEIDFKKVDILEDDVDGSYDFIVSNPPYISSEERKMMESNVLDHEPNIALFAEADPLIFYKKMIELAENTFSEDAWIYWEINQYYGEKLMDILMEKGFRNIELKKDINDNYRMIRFQNIKKS